MICNVRIAGLGGQGVIKASDILAEVAFQAGQDVKKSELHGMSQRGGSVSSDVRFGDRVLSPMIPEGEADFLVVLAPEWTDHFRPGLKPGGRLISMEIFPEGALPARRSVNVALLGALSLHLPFEENLWLETIRKLLSEKHYEANRQAFLAGKQCGHGA